MSQPLADRLRPKHFADYVGQSHLIGPDKPLRVLIDSDALHTMILWGPPGVGKTTLAKMIANETERPILTFSAVLVGIKEVKEAIKQAEQSLLKTPILFIDEIHRFNKAQQDALLPHVENGTVILIGATTENPSFSINNALLSRARIYVLESLSDQDLSQLLQFALSKSEGLADYHLKMSKAVQARLIQVSDGDARRLLNILEIVANKAKYQKDSTITLEQVELVIKQDHRRFDKEGDIFYEQISALHKSVRGSSPDGALYWLARMIDGGCDPIYIGRRLIRMASEDIGNADPRALTLAVDALEAYKTLGSPEGVLALAQATSYLAVAPKSNAVYKAFKQIISDIKKQPSHAVPMHLRNAPTKMMKSMAYGKGYRYDPDEADQFSHGQTYFPDMMGEQQYYYPTNNGLEKKIAEKLATLVKLKTETVE
tara:strand:+ start:22486 stop:23769 length:1284 start_codon:yes stop_codon:yes gene_type:complete